jgi:hypothetical protein
MDHEGANFQKAFRGFFVGKFKESFHNKRRPKGISIHFLSLFHGGGPGEV